MADVQLSAIEMDTGIQCRASIDMAVVNQYAERMTDADHFPPVQLFTRNGRHWIGDGWHRIMAAQSIGARTIDADVREGDRRDALKHALGANAQHGHRRTNADKRRCVEIALNEFASLSSRALAELCAVGDDLVLAVRRALPENGNATVTTSDGRQYPAKRTNGGTEAVTAATTTPRLTHNTPRTEKVEALKALLATGHNVEQISDSTGLSISNVRLLIQDFGLAVLKRKGRHAAKIDPAHVIEETVNAVVATSHGLRLIGDEPIDISREEAAAMLQEFSEAMKSLQWVVKTLKEIVHG